MDFYKLAEDVELTLNGVKSAVIRSLYYHKQEGREFFCEIFDYDHIRMIYIKIDEKDLNDFVFDMVTVFDNEIFDKPAQIAFKIKDVCVQVKKIYNECVFSVKSDDNYLNLRENEFEMINCYHHG